MFFLLLNAGAGLGRKYADGNPWYHFAICGLKPVLQLLNLTSTVASIWSANAIVLASACWIPRKSELLE